VGRGRRVGSADQAWLALFWTVGVRDEGQYHGSDVTACRHVARWGITGVHASAWPTTRKPPRPCQAFFDSAVT
jgi:hypothetical protein